MPRAFVEDVPEHIIFGAGAEQQAAGALVARGAQRVVLVTMARHRAGADRIAAALGDRAVGVFTELTQHVPLADAEKLRALVRETGADWVLAHGGGTAIGFAKAAALTEDVRIAAVPTTYAGSERTNIWGLSGPDGKTTGRDDRVRPSLVLYDPELTTGLPVALSHKSLLNALAHSVEALYDPEATSELLDGAQRSVAAIVAGLRAIQADPHDLDGRAEALYGAYLAATALDRANLALHHKLAHVLGGTFGTDHATTHAVLLPYVLGFNGPASPEALRRLEPTLGHDPAAALYDLCRDLGVPVGLHALGLQRSGLERAADVALERRYSNPRPFTRDDILALLTDAWHERRPSLHTTRLALHATGPHAVLDASVRGDLDQADVIVIAVHGRGASADRIAWDVELRIDDDGVAIVAPQALDRAWYPHGFTRPLHDNQPYLDSALAQLDAAWQVATSRVAPSQVVVTGFSQGACLLLSWLKLRDVTPGAVVAMSGAELAVDGDYRSLVGVPVHLGKSEGDPWIPQHTFEATVHAMHDAGVAPSTALEPGAEHAIHAEDAAALRRAVNALK